MFQIDGFTAAKHRTAAALAELMELRDECAGALHAAERVDVHRAVEDIQGIYDRFVKEG